MYGISGGAGYLPTDGRFIIGPSIHLGMEQQLGKNSSLNSLDPKDTHYIGVMLQSSLVQHSINAYRRRDRLE